MVNKHHLTLHDIFMNDFIIIYTILCLIVLKTLVTLGSLNITIFMYAKDIHIKVMFF